MSDPLQLAIVALSLLVALVATVYVVRDRAADALPLSLLVLLEVALLVQAVVGVVQLAGTDRDVNGLVFVGYLIGTLLFVPVAALWALGERSRAGTAGLIVLGIVVPVLELRLEQVWSPGG